MEAKKRSKKNPLVDALLVLFIVLGIALAFHGFKNWNSVLEVPDASPEAVAPNKVTKAGPAIDGSNSGSEWDTEHLADKGVGSVGPDGDDPLPAKASTEYKGDSVTIPAFGDVAAGQEGVETHEQTTRSTSGQRITAAMKDSCPGLANGSLCIPSQKKVIYYHGVGTHQYAGKPSMSVPSTYSAGWLKTTQPVGSSQGSSIFAAHVTFSGGTKGPFYTVPKVAIGEDIIVRNMAGKNYLYRVYKRSIVGPEDLPKEAFSKQGDPRISLVTCTGTYTGHSYSKRIVVFAAKVN